MSLPADEPKPPGRVPRAGLHHLAVETADLDNCVAWYTDFFGGTAAWTLDIFSDLTRGRLPGITRLTEVTAAGTRFHVFTRSAAYAPPHPDTLQFQHVCMTAGSASELTEWRDRWQQLFASGNYVFARPEPPTEIVVDDDGVSSFYAYDVNGLEYEFTHIPAEAEGR
ncbi:VOC family protein [Streptomyces dangxiongensis]|uniref:VOC family protein n=1 Tax=Streptomyces dangxiongensis TaxID=1442032 RepID=A0A3G2J7W9_9ACTN|nr:VOC family protein [Streptomyces dangxiongensis]AYN38234.1 VOC family protein [Streptomyces dangxiongensis]